MIEFRDVEKEWVDVGSTKYGLLTSADVDLYLVLMELNREQSFPERVTFGRYDPIERLGWDQHGRSYDRLGDRSSSIARHLQFGEERLLQCAEVAVGT